MAAVADFFQAAPRDDAQLIELTRGKNRWMGLSDIRRFDSRQTLARRAALAQKEPAALSSASSQKRHVASGFSWPSACHNARGDRWPVTKGIRIALPMLTGFRTKIVGA